jgi:hypothetical protein
MRPALATALTTACALVAATGASAQPGAIDADVRAASGGLLGDLHGHIASNGHGLGTFRPAPGVARAPLTVGLHDRRGTVVAHGGQLRMTLRIRRHGRLTGAGRLGRMRVRASGAGGEDLPDLHRGMRMLVVGRPSGEGYAALKRLFHPVRYRPRQHTRHRFLRERREFRLYAALVFGKDVPPAGIQSHRLLHAFYGAGKWVVVAPAGNAAQLALREVHPYVPGRAVPALAVRGVGRAGGAQQVRPTIAYPEPVLRSRSARLGRGTWFRSQLLRLGKAHMRTARNPSNRARAAEGSSVDFSLPYNAAAIEVAVPYRHEFTLTGPQNRARFQPCGWNQSTWNTWCSDTWYWKQQSGGDVTAGCQWFLDNGYYTIDRGTVGSVTSEQNSDGAYKVEWGDFGAAFAQWSGHQCPQNGSQSGVLQGNDYYYALYDSGKQQHTLVVLTDPTVSAATSGTLWHDNEQNGSGAIVEQNLVNPAEYVQDPRGLQETAWFLGKYTHSITLTGQPELGDLAFEYSGAKSLPNNQVTYTSQSSSSSTSQGFNVGIFGDSGTGGYSRTDTATTSVTVEAPSWQVSPAPGDQAITYSWTTNDPVSWSSITDGSGGWGLNALNRADFSPASLTVWSGVATCCQVSVASNRVLSLVDHFQFWNGSDVDDGFAVKQIQYGDSPNEIAVNTKNPAGPGIDLCDPLVAAPIFQNQCQGLASPPTVNIDLSCGTLPQTKGNFSLSLNGAQLGGTPPSAAGQPPFTFACPRSRTRLGPITIAPDTAATIGVNAPAGASVNADIGCFLADSEEPVVTSDIHGPLRVTVPAAALARGIPVNCGIFILPK